MERDLDLDGVVRAHTQAPDGGTERAGSAGGTGAAGGRTGPGGGAALRQWAGVIGSVAAAVVDDSLPRSGGS